MKDISFGTLIAFYLPGFIFLAGISQTDPSLQQWLLEAAASDGPTIGGFLFATIASLAAGLVISAARWMLMDNLIAFAFKGFKRPLPQINYAKLKDEHVYSAFQGAVENQYRYYQYYSNSLVAIAAAFVWFASHCSVTIFVWIVIGFLVVVLLSASVYALSNFYKTAADITS